MEIVDKNPLIHQFSKSKFLNGSVLRDAQKEVTPIAIKSGEVFRTECGKFSFVCTYCRSVWRNCDLLMIHINSHFKAKKQNIEMTKIPLASPEFVSVGEVKIEPGEETPTIQTGKTIDRDRLTLINGLNVTKLIPKQLATKDIVKMPPTTERDPPTPISRPSVTKLIPQQLATKDIVKMPPTTERDPPTPISRPSVTKLIPQQLATKDILKMPPSTERDPPTPISRPSVTKLIPKQLATKEISKSPPRIERAPLKPITGPSVSKSTPHQLYTTDMTKSPSTTRIVRIVKRTNDLNVAMALLKNETNEVTNCGDNSVPFRGRRIIKVIKRSHDDTKLAPNTILKLKRIRPNSSQISVKVESSAVVDLTTDLDGPEKIENSESSFQTAVKETVGGSQPQPNEHSNDWLDPESRRKVYVRRLCYQCEMEPKVQRPCEPRRHRCLICPLWFANHDEFYLHVKEIHQKDPAFVSCQHYYCYACERRYPFRQHLIAHIKSHQGDPETHLCAICGSSFDTKRKFKLHMDKHSERKYKCEHCNKAFTRVWVLRQHLLFHTKCDSTHVCEICSKAFRLYKYLKRHMAVHDEPKILCRHCDAKFHFSSVRRAHEQTRHHVV